MGKIQSVKGMRDLLPPQSEHFASLEEEAARFFQRYGYSEIRTPILEETALFARGVGEETDMVSKEMFSFPDGKDQKMLALRPEGTASVVRAYLENRVGERLSLVKWYYLGPMFRRERPAAGRYRQFFQIGAECIGVATPEADAEMLEMLWGFFQRVGAPGLSLKLNSIGDAVCRPAYREALVRFLSGVAEKLCEDCKRRSQTNPLRVLDCKREECQAATREAPVPIEHLCEPCRAHHNRLLEILNLYQIPYLIAPRLVRGLDYYNRTAFEITASQGLGAQDAVCGGGRYDGLIRLLGGPDTPAIGFAIGLDRLVLVLEAAQKLSSLPPPPLFLGFFDKNGQERALLLGRDLRREGIRCQVDLRGGKLKGQLDRANKLGARFVLLLGGDELSRGVAVLRDMAASTQEEIALDGVIAQLRERLVRT